MTLIKLLSDWCWSEIRCRLYRNMIYIHDDLPTHSVDNEKVYFKGKYFDELAYFAWKYFDLFLSNENATFDLKDRHHYLLHLTRKGKQKPTIQISEIKYASKHNDFLIAARCDWLSGKMLFFLCQCKFNLYIAKKRVHYRP